MKHTKTKSFDSHIRNAFLVIGAVLILAGSGKSTMAYLTDQGSSVLDRANFATLEQGFAIHPSAEAPTSGGMLALGSLFLLVGLGFHAYTHLPNDRKVKIRRAPSYSNSKKRGRSRRAKQVIWIEKVIRL